MKKRRLKVGDLVKIDTTRMTHRGYFPPNWDTSAVLIVLWVPSDESSSQVVSVLMKGVPCTISSKNLRHIDEKQEQ